MARWNDEDRTPLALLRASAGLTRTEASVLMQVGMITLARYENGITDVPFGIGEQMAKLYKVSFEDIPENLSNAYVAIEDERYYKHGGIDLRRTTSAVISYVFHGGSSSFGGSSIAQQLVKNLTGDNSSTISRKVNEWWKACVVDSAMSKEEILELLEEAGLTGWYKELPDGLETMVGERGIKLSAGQKQRLNLIRGILIDKDLYFFDEPTSNLDSESEEKITNMIEKYLSDKTYVIVTHRPRLKDLCNKHYIFEHHMMKEVIKI